MSRSVRAETRQSKKDESKKHHVSNLFSARKWEKKWVTICDTTMRIYKWVPVNCNGNEAKKTLKQIESSQNSINDKENSKIPRNDEDSSNTCFSFSEIQFQNNSSDKFLFSEDSNSQSSDTIPVKKFKAND